MGTSSWNLDVICKLYDEGHFRIPAAIADIGCMQLSHASNESVREFASHFGRMPDEQALGSFGHYSYMGDLYRAAGFEYVSLDITDAPYVLRFDLNNDQVPLSLKGKYDIVMNTGTTEHVLNQLNALKTMHDLAKPGGLIFSLFLINGFGGHGLLRYCNRFVKLLAEANKYEVILADVHARTFSQWRKEVGPAADPDGFIGDQCEWTVLKKTSDVPFSTVVDMDGFQDCEDDVLLSDRERLGVRPDAGALMAQQKRLVREKDALLAEKDARLSERDAQLSERDARLSERDAQLSERDARLAEKDAQLSERDARLSEKDAQLSERGAQLSERDARLSEKDAQLSERGAQLSERDAQLSERDAQLSKRDAWLLEKDALIAEQKQRLADSNATLDAIRNSRSWRVTKPLRKTAGWLRGGG